MICKLYFWYFMRYFGDTLRECSRTGKLSIFYWSVEFRKRGIVLDSQ